MAGERVRVRGQSQTIKKFPPHLNLLPLRGEKKFWVKSKEISTIITKEQKLCGTVYFQIFIVI